MIGEGGSGGAVAIGVADRVLMQENAIYSVISPEGCATILWRDVGESAEGSGGASSRTPATASSSGSSTAIVPEPPGGAQTDHDAAALLLGDGPARRCAEVSTSIPRSEDASAVRNPRRACLRRPIPREWGVFAS